MPAECSFFPPYRLVYFLQMPPLFPGAFFLFPRALRHRFIFFPFNFQLVAALRANTFRRLRRRPHPPLPFPFPRYRRLLPHVPLFVGALPNAFEEAAAFLIWSFWSSYLNGESVELPLYVLMMTNSGPPLRGAADPRCSARKSCPAALVSPSGSSDSWQQPLPCTY